MHKIFANSTPQSTNIRHILLYKIFIRSDLISNVPYYEFQSLQYFITNALTLPKIQLAYHMACCLSSHPRLLAPSSTVVPTLPSSSIAARPACLWQHFWDGWPIEKFFLYAHKWWQSGPKILCWYVRKVLRGLPTVSGPRHGKGGGRVTTGTGSIAK